MKTKGLIILFVLGICLKAQALVSFGGYVPFGFSTQTESDGARNATGFEPAIGFNTVLPLPQFNHLFFPEIGLVLHGSDDFEDYSKSTLYILLDLGYPLTDTFALRYGLGTFMTRIKGAGGTVQRRNGGSTVTFDRPAKSSTSYNTTVNLGAELKFNANWSGRLETFWFSAFNNEARDVSYILNATYYL